jgi:hypothetical protein
MDHILTEFKIMLPYLVIDYLFVHVVQPLALISQFLVNCQGILCGAPKLISCQCISKAIAGEEKWIGLPVECESGLYNSEHYHLLLHLHGGICK